MNVKQEIKTFDLTLREAIWDSPSRNLSFEFYNSRRSGRSIIGYLDYLDKKSERIFHADYNITHNGKQCVLNLSGDNFQLLIGGVFKGSI